MAACKRDGFIPIEACSAGELQTAEALEAAGFVKMFGGIVLLTAEGLAELKKHVE